MSAGVSCISYLAFDHEIASPNIHVMLLGVVITPVMLSEEDYLG